MNSLSSNKKHEKGQGLVEYALILVLVAIVVIAALTILGPRIQVVFDKVNIQILTAQYNTQQKCTAAGYGWHAAGQPIPSYGNNTITFTNDTCVHSIH
jgi:pilus assembly protein Flp/PilA